MATLAADWVPKSVKHDGFFTLCLRDFATKNPQLEVRNHFDFHDGGLRQGGNLDGGTRGKIASEIFGVDFVHAGEVREVGEENGALHHVAERELLIFENRFDVFQNSFGLRLDIAVDEIASGRVERDLSGAEQHVANADSVIVGADCGGGFCGFNDLFGCHNFFFKGKTSNSDY